MKTFLQYNTYLRLCPLRIKAVYENPRFLIKNVQTLHTTLRHEMCKSQRKIKKTRIYKYQIYFFNDKLLPALLSTFIKILITYIDFWFTFEKWTSQLSIKTVFLCCLLAVYVTFCLKAFNFIWGLGGRDVYSMYFRITVPLIAKVWINSGS